MRQAPILITKQVGYFPRRLQSAFIHFFLYSALMILIIIVCVLCVTNEITFPVHIDIALAIYKLFSISQR